jgi:beta-lactamase class A
VRDLAADREYAEDADAPVYLSSTIKVVVMLEALRQIDAGELSLRDSVVFGPDDLRDGIGPLRRSSLGRSLSVRALLGLMMDESDNAAADLLMGILGMENVNRLPAARGAHFSLLVTLLDERRLVYGRLHPAGYGLTPEQVAKLREPPTLDAQAALFSSMIGRSPAFTGEDLAAAFGAYYARRINSASMRDMGKLLSQIASCEELSPVSCALARRLMASCATGANRVRAGLPPGVEWGHKTGTQVGRACDVGILYARPDRPIVIAACTRDFETVRDAERLMADVGRAVWKATSPDLEEADGRAPPSP